MGCPQVYFRQAFMEVSKIRIVSSPDFLLVMLEEETDLLPCNKKIWLVMSGVLASVLAPST